MSDLSSKDSEQDSKLAVLESKIGSYRERIIGLETYISNVPKNDDLDAFVSRIEKDYDDIRNRVRALERWVWGAAAVIAAGVVIAGLVANAQEGDRLWEQWFHQAGSPATTLE